MASTVLKRLVVHVLGPLIKALYKLLFLLRLCVLLTERELAAPGGSGDADEEEAALQRLLDGECCRVAACMAGHSKAGNAGLPGIFSDAVRWATSIAARHPTVALAWNASGSLPLEHHKIGRATSTER